MRLIRHLSLLAVFLFAQFPISVFADDSCGSRLTHSYIFSGTQDFLEKVESTVGYRTDYEKISPSEWDFSDLGKAISEMSERERTETLSAVRPELMRSMAKQGKDIRHFRYELALLGLQDEDSWIRWIREVVADGKNIQELQAAASFIHQLPRSLRQKILQIIRSNWRNLQKRANSNDLTSTRRSVDLILAYMIPADQYIQESNVWGGFEEYLWQFHYVLGVSTFFPDDVIKVVKKLHSVVRAEPSGAPLLIYGSFVNGKAGDGSDLDYSDYKMLKYDSKKLEQAMKSAIGRALEFSQAGSGNIPESNFEGSLSYPALDKNWVAIYLTKNQIIFYLSPKFKPFMSDAERANFSPKRIIINVP